VAFVVSAAGTRLYNCSPGVGIPDRKRLKSDLEQALAKWNALPLSERRPGAVQVGDRPAVDPKRATQLPPADCLIVRVWNRQLGRNERGELRYTVPEDYVDEIRTSVYGKAWGTARYREPADDYMWVPRPEWQALMPPNPRKGQNVKVPVSLAERLIRFHLDPARGQCEWMNFTRLEAKPDVVRLTLTVEEATAAEVRLRLEGSANLREDRGPGKGGTIVYQPRLLGYLAYDPAKKSFTRFDIVALGDVTGQPADENPVGARTGTQPLGVAFELVAQPTPADCVCPRGQRDSFASSVPDYYLGLKRSGGGGSK
jgi:hypothetical protein